VTDKKTLDKSWRLGPIRLSGGFRELVIIGLIYGAYRCASGFIPHREDIAMGNAYRIVDVERFLRIFVERNFQSLFVDNSLLTLFVNALYTICYYPALVLFAIWAFKRHRKQYYIVRNVFVVSAITAFVCFALFPTAPPRMLSDLGFIDTMSRQGTGDYSSPAMRNLANPYAAMPSLHFGWTLLIGVATVYIARRWWLKVVGVLVPLFMLIGIVATANHFILDAIAGAVVVGLSYSLVRLFYRWNEGSTVFGFKRTPSREGEG
jgi:membrane-associated phospholipid phosphatase